MGLFQLQNPNPTAAGIVLKLNGLAVVGLTGPVTIGTDPGGSELLRVGGAIAANGPLSTTATAGNTAQIQASGNGLALGAGLKIQHDGSADAFIFNAANRGLYFGTNNATRAEITATGSFIIGTDPGGSQLLRVGGTSHLGGSVTLADAANIIVNATTGTKIGTATTQKLGFWDATPVVQPASADQAAADATASTDTSPYGYTTAAQADGIVTLLNEIRAALVSVGIIKGAA